MDSITKVYPGAVLYEREIQDLLGVKFEGISDSRRMILPEDFPKAGLQLWLCAGRVEQTEGVITLIEDLSGNENHARRDPATAVPAANPVLTNDAASGQHALKITNNSQPSAFGGSWNACGSKTLTSRGPMTCTTARLLPDSTLFTSTSGMPLNLSCRNCWSW
jgi:hypothetical protein